METGKKNAVIEIKIESVSDFIAVGNNSKMLA
jgi:hypothetical protein